ncbi:MAG: hypothetical protein M1495_09735 [Bacteroidetes bacterium]|nr:hypothetical protein [Bacteroidota bacterium]MCL6099693.1 hypothetical protein [Bacteroidota bacterium]
MKKSIMLLIVFTLAVSILAQTKKEVKVTDKAKACFAKHYPNVKEVKWGKEGKSEFEAEFKQNGEVISVVIDAEGNLKETETDIAKSELPNGVEEYVEKNYQGWNITEAAKIVNAKGVVTFEAQISKGKWNKDLIFTKNGSPVMKNTGKGK